MAENQGVSALPLPPMQYVNQYTDENIKKGRAPLPPPPIQDNYMMFGAPFSAEEVIIRPLESQGIRRLYPQNYDHKRELKKLNHSLLINFLDLIDILVTSPESQKRQEKMEDLNLIFIHMHHLINEFRPHQARETLRVMLEVQNEQCLEITDRFQKHLDKVQEIIQTAVATLPDDNTLQSVKSLIEAELLSGAASGVTSGDGVEINVKKETRDSAMETGDGAAGEPCDRLDKMMCDIIDTMNT